MKIFAAFITVAAMAIAVFLYYKAGETTQVDIDPPPLESLPTATAEPEATPATDVGAPLDQEQVEHAGFGSVPDLEESDSYLENLLGKEAGWASILKAKHLIRKAVTTVELLSREENPTSQIQFLQPKSSFKFEEQEESLSLSPENFARYEPLVAFIEGLDTRRSTLLYKHLYPVLLLAYDELGNGDQAFPKKLDRVMQQVLDFVPPEGEIKLAGKDGTYIFTDPTLEEKNHLEKALIRMGPENTRRLQAKIQAIREALQEP